MYKYTLAALAVIGTAAPQLSLAEEVCVNFCFATGSFNGVTIVTCEEVCSPLLIATSFSLPFPGGESSNEAASAEWEFTVVDVEAAAEASSDSMTAGVSADWELTIEERSEGTEGIVEDDPSIPNLRFRYVGPAIDAAAESLVMVPDRAFGESLPLWKRSTMTYVSRQSFPETGDAIIKVGRIEGSEH